MTSMPLRAMLLGMISALALIIHSPHAFLIPFASGIVTFYAGAALRASRSATLLWPTLALPLVILLSYRYLFPAAADAGFIENFAIPIGLSYYTFKQMHFLIECQRGNFEESTLSCYLLYLFYFPMFIAGPIERFGNFQGEIRNLGPVTQNMISYGLERIALGLMKKLIISDLILDAMAMDHLSAQDLLTLDWHVLVYIALIKFLRIYMDFSGYTDIAIGISALFGIKLMENFRSPLTKPNLAEFWRSWHISLSSWARDYIYFPVLMKYRITWLALILTMLTIGAWHSLAPGWLLWGLHHGIGLALLAAYHHRTKRSPFWRDLRKKRLWHLLGIIAVWFYISIGHALTFFPENLVFSLKIYGRMFGVFL